MASQIAILLYGSLTIIGLFSLGIHVDSPVASAFAVGSAASTYVFQVIQYMRETGPISLVESVLWLVSVGFCAASGLFSILAIVGGL